MKQILQITTEPENSVSSTSALLCLKKSAISPKNAALTGTPIRDEIVEAVIEEQNEQVATTPYCSQLKARSFTNLEKESSNSPSGTALGKAQSKITLNAESGDKEANSSIAYDSSPFDSKK